jgi:hypothetical protein
MGQWQGPIGKHFAAASVQRLIEALLVRSMAAMRSIGIQPVGSGRPAGRCRPAP